MAVKNFKEMLQYDIPIFAYNPSGILDLSLIKAVIESGGMGLIDLEGIVSNQRQQFLETISKLQSNRWGIRIGDVEQAKTLIDTQIPIPVIIIAFNIEASLLEKLRTKTQH